MRRGESLSSDGETRLSKKEALERLVPVPVVDTMYYVHADGNYSLHGLDLLADGQGLRVAQEEEKPTTALLERLDDEIRETIVETVDRSMEENVIKGMNLQVDVYFTQKGIHHAVILGVGMPRPGMRHYALADIPNSVPERYRMLQGE